MHGCMFFCENNLCAKTYSNQTLMNFIFRVRQNINKAIPLVDPDPGQCYTAAKKRKCLVCCPNGELPADVSENQSKSPGDPLTYSQGNWTTETTFLPQKFSYISIVDHAKKSGRNAASYVEKPLEKGYKFFF